MLCNYLVKDLDTTVWDRLQYCSGNRDLDDGDPTIYIYMCPYIQESVQSYYNIQICIRKPLIVRCLVTMTFTFEVVPSKLKKYKDLPLISCSHISMYGCNPI